MIRKRSVYLLRSWWRWLNGWPEDPRKKPAATFPKTMHFIDGPMKDKRLPAEPCLHWGWFEHQVVAGVGILTEVRYIWDTLYPNAEVAYMRLAPPSVTPYTFGIDLAEPLHA